MHRYDRRVMTQAERAEGKLFGETAPFTTIADLAAALPDRPPAAVMLLPIPTTTEEAADNEEAEPQDGDEALRALFEIIQHERSEPETPRAQREASWRPSAQPREAGVMHAGKWSVRIPGVEPLPQRQPGRTGWSIRNSIRILRRAEDLTLRLRQEAVIVAFDGASRALRGER
jgi:hypothetical protein